MQLDVVEVASGVFHAWTRYVGWVVVVDGDEVTLVDTGYPGDRGRVLASLERIGRRGSDVSAIVLTHAHRDHRGNARWFQDEHGVMVKVHEEERAYARGERVEEVPVPMLLRMSWRPSILVFEIDLSTRLRALGTKFLDVVDTFHDGPVDAPGEPVSVHTPGHTSGHVALHLPSRGVLVAGDALMTEHPIGTSVTGAQLLPAYFNHDDDQAAASLERLRGLQADVVVTGHGPPYRGSPAAAVEQALASRAALHRGVGGHW